jgi:hypothetical protein
MLFLPLMNENEGKWLGNEWMSHTHSHISTISKPAVMEEGRMQMAELGQEGCSQLLL